MTISLNGESVDSREARTIAELIDRYQLPPQFDFVAAEESAFVFIRGHSYGAHDDLCGSGGL